jgi:hypothetical protein
LNVHFNIIFLSAPRSSKLSTCSNQYICNVNSLGAITLQDSKAPGGNVQFYTLTSAVDGL